MKKYSRHSKQTNRSNKKIIFTSAAIILAGGISIGSYLIFSSNSSPSQDQSININPVQIQEDAETVSVSKVKSPDTNSDITDEARNHTEAFSVSKVKNYDINSDIINSLSQNLDFESWNQNCEPNLVVVNSNNPIPKDFPSNIVDFKEVQVSNIMKESLYKMINDASRDGINLWVSSAYRSIDRQTVLYNKEVNFQKKNANSLEEAKRLASSIVAEPGKSEHNTGLAVDFNGVRDDFFKSKEFNWLVKNSANYGFILRYKKEKANITNVIFEPWHFRYVGKEHAKVMNAKDLCLEEYINLLISQKH